MNLRSLTRFSIFTFAALTISRTSHADVVVRDSQTADEEFQAQALALGHTPIANWLASDEHRSIAPSMKEIFQARLVDAQSAWIRRAPGTFDAAPVDRLMDLETEADWTSNEREAFVVFSNRKSEMMSADATKLSPNTDLRADFPADVSAMLVNGREVTRAEFSTYSFPRRPTRVTLLSNVYAPVTVKLSGFETTWPRFERRAWVSENCAQVASPAVDSETTISILASTRCRDAIKISPATAGDRELIEKFGLDRLKSEPMREPEKAKPMIERPWVWVAIGVLAVGAVVAIERSQNQASVQPVSRDGW